MDDQDEEDHTRSISLEDYIQQVMDAVDPSYRMRVTEQHRKKMTRCLMGYANKKSEFNLKLQSIHLKEQWARTKEFVEQDLSAVQVDEVKAPQFQEGIQLMKSSEDSPFCFQPTAQTNNTQCASPTRFFSFLARGRAYQGKLQRLLEDVAPQLVSTYLDIVQEPNEFDLMRKLVMEETSADSEQNATDLPLAVRWKEPLLQVLDMDLVGNKDNSQPEDGGKGMGLQGEVDLTSFLLQKHSNSSTTMVLSNVYIKPPNKHLRNINQSKNPRKRLSHVILSNIDLVGMTSEFDALVVEENDAREIQILELWEAKASLHPISIGDVLFKKVRAMERLLNDPDARIYFYPTNEKEGARREPSIVPFSNRGTMPQIGMFGVDLMDPRSAARQTQFVHCEKLLEESPDAVVEALETGSVSPPDVKPKLQRVLDEGLRLKPFLVVPALGSP